MNRKLWLLMTWLLVVPAFVQAASVRGVVVDYETNKPIANVKVAIRNVSAVTDFDGNFELKKVRAGSVVVVFTAADYIIVAAERVFRLQTLHSVMRRWKTPSYSG